MQNRAYSETEIQALKRLQKHIKTIYCGDTMSGRIIAVRRAIDELEEIAELMGLDPIPQTDSENQPASTLFGANLQQARHEGDMYEILSIEAPNRVEFYQKFSITMVLLNTGNFPWQNRTMVTRCDNEVGPQASVTEIETTNPGDTCVVRVPVDARGFEGTFELKLDMLERFNTGISQPAYAAPIAAIPVKITFAPGMFD